MNILNTIVKYDMTAREAKAYKLACMYDHIARKLFPKYRHDPFHSVGDPRKKMLFRHAWKMLEEVEGKIPARDYKLFIYAQFKVFERFMNDDGLVFITPACLNGPKAWNRWLVFKKKFDQRQQFKTVDEQEIKINHEDRVVQELARTKKFLAGKDVQASLDDGTMRRWVAFNQVAPYFAWLSPVVQKWLEARQLTVTGYFGETMGVYRQGAESDQARTYFRQEFGG